MSKILKINFKLNVKVYVLNVVLSVNETWTIWKTEKKYFLHLKYGVTGGCSKKVRRLDIIHNKRKSFKELKKLEASWKPRKQKKPN